MVGMHDTLKFGDGVTVQGTVLDTCVGANEVWVSVSIGSPHWGSGNFKVHRRAIVAHMPKPPDIKIGDEVYLPAEGCRYDVVALFPAWLVVGKGTRKPLIISRESLMFNHTSELWVSPSWETNS